MIHRRCFIGASGVALTTSLAGCIDTLSKDTVALEFVEVINIHESSHTISVEVEKDGEVVVRRTVNLNGLVNSKYESESLKGEWINSTGDFVIRTKLADSTDWIEVDLPGSENTSVGVEIMVQDDGELGIFTAL